MKSTYIGKILIFITMVVFLPTLVGAQQTSGQDATTVCNEVLGQIATMAKPVYSSMAVSAGEALSIPLVMKNRTKTPLSDVHLFVKITRLGKIADIVSLRYDSRVYALAPGESTTTAVLWKTSKNDIAGGYRVDFYVLPNSTYSVSGVFTNVPSTSYVYVNVQNEQKIAAMDVSIDKTKMVVNGRAIEMGKNMLFDENEKGALSLHILNSADHAVPARLFWRIYPNQQIDGGHLLYSTSTDFVVSAQGSTFVDVPFPIFQNREYIALAEIEEGGQSVIVPSSLSRATTKPLLVGVLGIMGGGEITTPFDLRKGKTYTLFACPSGMPLVSPASISLGVVGVHGEKIISQNYSTSINKPVAPILFSFLSPRNYPNSSVVLTSTSEGNTEKYTIPISCGKSKTGECAPLTLLQKIEDPSFLSLILIGAGVVLSVGVLFYGVRLNKRSQHEEIPLN